MNDKLKKKFERWCEETEELNQEFGFDITDKSKWREVALAIKLGLEVHPAPINDPSKPGYASDAQDLISKRFAELKSMMLKRVKKHRKVLTIKGIYSSALQSDLSKYLGMDHYFGVFIGMQIALIAKVDAREVVKQLSELNNPSGIQANNKVFVKINSLDDPRIVWMNEDLLQWKPKVGFNREQAIAKMLHFQEQYPEEFAKIIAKTGLLAQA